MGQEEILRRVVVDTSALISTRLEACRTLDRILDVHPEKGESDDVMLKNWVSIIKSENIEVKKMTLEKRVKELEIIVKKLGDTVDDVHKNHFIIQPYLNIWKEHGELIEECRRL